MSPVNIESASENPARIPENNMAPLVTAASDCDNPRTSTPASSLDDSSSSVLSQLLAANTPQVTPITATNRAIPKARLLTSEDCLRMLEEKEAKKQKEIEEKEQR